MKQKNLTGLRAGVYQESSKKSVLIDLLASVSIFLVLAEVCYTVSGFSASGISKRRSCCSPFCWRLCCSLSCSREIRC